MRSRMVWRRFSFSESQPGSTRSHAGNPDGAIAKKLSSIRENFTTGLS